MSIPPAISTTRRPRAQIRFTALLFRSEVMLPSVRKLSVASDRKTPIASRTTPSRSSTR